jgi:hypothetical protein
VSFILLEIYSLKKIKINKFCQVLDKIIEKFCENVFL